MNYLGGIYGDTDTLGWASDGTFDDFSFTSGNAPRIDWNNIFNQSVGLTSQIVGAWGHNQTQQIYPGVGPIGGGYNPSSILSAQALAQQQYAAQYGGQNGQGGVGLDDAATSITGFITRNPLLVAGGVLGVYLLMREPPRSRR